MADEAIQFTEGSGGKYARMLTGPTVDGHATVTPYHFSLDGGLGLEVTRGTPISSSDITTAVDLTGAPASGKKIRILDLFVSVAVAMKIQVIEETSGDVIASAYLPTNGNLPLSLRCGIEANAADRKLQLKGSVAGGVEVICTYYSV